MLLQALIIVAVVIVIVANGLLTAVFLLARHNARSPTDRPAVDASLAIVRPLRGSGASSVVSNESMVSQSYSGLTEIVFVASSPVDEGLELARSTSGADPRLAHLVARVEGPISTDKARNMTAGWASTSAPFVAFSDADVVLAPGILDACMQRFDDPTVGAVFAPVVHCPHGLLSVLLAQLSSGDKLAAIRAFDRLGILGVLEGGLMILRRSAVDRIGGIQVIADTVADDLRLGAALQAGGFRVHAGPAIRHELVHASLREAAAQYHRWMVCQRSESPWLMWPQLMFHPIVVPLIVVLCRPSAWASWAVLAISIAWRMALTAGIERSLLRPVGLRFGWWVLARPIADLVHFSFGVSAYLFPFVSWGGVRYQLGRRGRIVDAHAAPERRARPDRDLLEGRAVLTARRVIAFFANVSRRVVVRSAMVGAVATAADLAALLLATRVLRVTPAVANVPTLALGLLIQFGGNKVFAFRDRSTAIVRQGARFLGVEAVTLVINIAAFHVLAVLVGLPVVVARILGTFIVYVGFSLPAWRRVVFARVTDLGFSPRARVSPNPEAIDASSNHALPRVPWKRA